MVWVLTIGVLEVNPELDSIRAQRGRARSALFSRVLSIISTIILVSDICPHPPALTSTPLIKRAQCGVYHMRYEVICSFEDKTQRQKTLLRNRVAHPLGPTGLNDYLLI